MASIPSFPFANAFLPGALVRRSTFPSVAGAVGSPAASAGFTGNQTISAVSNDAPRFEATNPDNPSFAQVLAQAAPSFAEQVQTETPQPPFAEVVENAGESFAEQLEDGPVGLGAFLRDLQLSQPGPRSLAEAVAANQEPSLLEDTLEARGAFAPPGRLQIQGGARLARNAEGEGLVPEVEPLPSNPPVTGNAQGPFTPTVLPGETFDLLI